MFSTEEAAAPHVALVVDREEKIGVHIRLLDLLPDPVLRSRPIPLISLKTLYSDFVVRELSPYFNEEKPLRMTSVPISAAKELPPPAGKRPRQEAQPLLQVETIAATEEALRGVLEGDVLSALTASLSRGEEKIVLGFIADKAKRTVFHQTIKSLIGATHISGTDNGCLFVSMATPADRREEKRRSNPIKQRNFLHFTLYKENLDSSAALRALSTHLHMSTRQFQYCGTKDKRAVTLQRVAVRDLDPDRLTQINSCSFGTQGTLKVCDFRVMPDGLRLGDANGNHFSIVLRVHPCSSVPTEEQLQCMTTGLVEYGVVNYFGPQRFGTTTVLTSDVGIAILREDFRAALQLVMASKACIVPDMKEVLPLVDAGQYAEALQKTMYFCHQERDMLKYLTTHPNDYLGSFQAIPRTMAMMYCHAVQSLLWNRMVSKRLGGSRVLPEVGDLVLESVYQKRVGCVDVGEVTTSTGDGEETKDALPAVRNLTALDDLHKFMLADVVLPLPGPDKDLVFPTCAGCTKEDYVTAAKELGVARALFDPNASNALVKVFHYHGAYRAVCIRPSNVKLEKRTVVGWRTPVLQTDWEMLQAKEDTKRPEVPATAADTEHKTNVIVANFSLPSGCYATSVLREFCVACSESFHTAKGSDNEPDESG